MPASGRRTCSSKLAASRLQLDVLVALLNLSWAPRRGVTTVRRRSPCGVDSDARRGAARWRQLTIRRAGAVDVLLSSWRLRRALSVRDTLRRAHLLAAALGRRTLVRPRIVVGARRCWLQRDVRAEHDLARRREALPARVARYHSMWSAAMHRRLNPTIRRRTSINGVVGIRPRQLQTLTEALASELASMTVLDAEHVRAGEERTACAAARAQRAREGASSAAVIRSVTATAGRTPLFETTEPGDAANCDAIVTAITATLRPIRQGSAASVGARRRAWRDACGPRGRRQRQDRARGSRRRDLGGPEPTACRSS